MTLRSTGTWYRYWARKDAPNGQARTETLKATPITRAEPTLPTRPRQAGAETRPRPVPAMFHVEPRESADGRAVVLTVANQKGGVGKTTTAVSLAAALAEHHLRVLLIDLDPQGNATSGVGLRSRVDNASIYDVILGQTPMEAVVEPTAMTDLYVVPANIDLAGAEIELVTAFNREQQLRLALEPTRENFDVIVVDCPPSLGLLTVNALTAGDGVIVPIQCEYFALEGLGALRRNTDLIRSQLNPSLEILGFVLTMLDARTRLSQQVVDEVRNYFGDLVFDTRIPRSVRLAEAPGFGQPITTFDPSSRGALAYRRLATEVLARIDLPDRTPMRQGVS